MELSKKKKKKKKINAIKCQDICTVLKSIRQFVCLFPIESQMGWCKAIKFDKLTTHHFVIATYKSLSF